MQYLVALGITLLYAQKETRGFEVYLYGAVLSLTDRELVLLYGVGLVIFLLVTGWFNRLILVRLNANLAASRTAELRALIDYTLALRRLDKATGRNLEQWNIKLADALYDAHEELKKIRG